MAHFTWFDWAISGLIVVSICISFFRGFLREAFSLVGWIAAILLAIKFSYAVSNLFSGQFTSMLVRYLVAFTLITLVVIVVSSLSSHLLKSVVHKTGLGFVDNVLGLCFGVVKGVLVVTVFIMLLNVTSLQGSGWFKDSQLVGYFHPMVAWLNQRLPDKLNKLTAWVDKRPKNIKELHKLSHLKQKFNH